MIRIQNIVFLKVTLLTSLFLWSFSAISDTNSAKLIPVTVQIHWNHQFEFAGFYAAIKQGYYKELGLDVTVLDWRPDINVLEEVTSGRADFGIGYTNFLLDFLNGEPIKLVMSSLQTSPKVILSHYPMTDLSDLGGKSIMFSDSKSILALLSRVEKDLLHIPATGDLQDFIDRKVDLYVAYTTNEPYRLRKLGVPYFIVDPSDFGMSGYGNLVITSEEKTRLRPEVVQKFKEATIKGWYYALAESEAVIDYILANYPVVKSRGALLYEAQAIVPYVKSRNIPIGSVTGMKLLASVIEAMEAGLIEDQVVEIRSLEKFIFNPEEQFYTAEELEFLANNPVITLANHINRVPFEFYDERGYQGIIADYIKLFEARLGVDFKPQRDGSWQEVVQKMKAGELDVFTGGVATAKKRSYISFTKPYLTFPIVLVAERGVTYVQDFQDLANQTIAVNKGFCAEMILKRDYPQINILTVESVIEGLQAVLTGRADFFSGNLASVNYVINKQGLVGLRVVGAADNNFELVMGVHKDNPILFSIIEKTLASITAEERQEIYNNWIQLEVYHRADNRQLWQIFLVSLAIILTLLVVLFGFLAQKNSLKKYISQVHELTYATLININTFKFLWVSDSYVKLTGYSKEELLRITFLSLMLKESLSTKQLEILAKIKTGESWTGDIEGKSKNQNIYYVQMTISPHKNIFGKIKTCWVTRVDITDKKHLEELIIRDDLTGVYNRRYFNQIIKQEVNRAKRDGKALSVAMLDIDFFKAINDTYGHQRGDAVLKKVAKVLEKNFNRGDDFVFRIGGEEFFILAHFDSEDEFKNYLEYVASQVENMKIVNKKSSSGFLTVSFGASFLPATSLVNGEKIYKEVDAKLYCAKQSGRNKVVIENVDGSCQFDILPKCCIST